MLRRLVATVSVSALLLAGCSAPVAQTESQIDSSQSFANQLQTSDLQLAATSSKAVKPGAKLNGPTALSVLKTLPVKGKAPATGYNRNAKYGNAWKDSNKNKCDERQDTLKRDMSKVKYKDRKKCTVKSGTLNDLYTGKRINWKVKSGSMDIDHVVALKNSWISGAQKLSGTQRQALVNDPLNLIAADASANRQKGDKNAAEWLPKNKSFRCQYVATQISVKKKYALSVTSAEKKAMTKVLNSCKKQKAAKVTPIKPQGKAQSNTTKKETSPAPSVKGTVSPGAFCKAADAGKRGKAKSGKTYTCKRSATDQRLRWRA